MSEQTHSHTGNGHPPPIDIEALPLIHIELITLGTIDGEVPAKRSTAMMKLVRWFKTHDYQLDAVLTLLQAHPDGIARGYGGGRLETQLTRIWDKIRDTTRPATWVDQLHGADRGKPTNDVANAMLALDAAPELAGCLGYDELARRPVVTKPLPGTDHFGHPVEDIDVIRLQAWLQEAGMRKLPKEVVHDAVDKEAKQHPFHPVKDYLGKLVWDGLPRLDRWLTYYLGVERLDMDREVGDDYVDRVGAMFMISAVARIYQPGCQCDYVLVLEGPQGNLKSSAVGALANPWFSDHLPDLHKNEKDVSQHLNGKWIIEIPELSAMVKADATTIKSFITRRVERYRRSYGRLDVEEPRQCVPVGTTNEASYLRDPTGGRRFWPVRVISIDLPALVDDRDQLWAEAVHRYRAGEHWWPDRDFEQEVMLPQQEARYEQDVWLDRVAEYLAPLGRVTVHQVATLALSFTTDRIGTREQRRIIALLRALGWVEKRDMKARWWEPGP